MARTRHTDVAKAFVAGKAATNSVLHTDGTSIYVNRDQCLATRAHDGTLIVAHMELSLRQHPARTAVLRSVAGRPAHWVVVASRRATRETLLGEYERRLQFYFGIRRPNPDDPFGE